MKNLRNRLIYWKIPQRARFAHWLIDLAKSIMPPGHCRGRFRNVSEEMRRDLAAYGAELSWMKADLMSVKARLEKVNTVMEKAREAKAYEWSDALRDALKR